MPNAASSAGIGIVKAVLSGDTVVLQGASRAGTQAPELQLSLSHLSAPRIARHPDQRDEPFGWPAREYLRKVAVGKQVRFRVDYKVGWRRPDAAAGVTEYLMLRQRAKHSHAVAAAALRRCCDAPAAGYGTNNQQTGSRAVAPRMHLAGLPRACSPLRSPRPTTPHPPPLSVCRSTRSTAPSPRCGCWTPPLRA